MTIKHPEKVKPLNRFLNRILRKRPRALQAIASKESINVWNDINCLDCANCCRTMTPTYTPRDIKDIAAFLKISTGEMKRKWLKKERATGNWINKTTPCQFLDLETNLCRVYDVRPADCAGFPHLKKKYFINYVHVHKQNLDECPATFKMIERMNELMNQE